ncbi:hypothetical protein [Bacillus alkalicellulosilyticus]|uniref:hypothetical protein n=1 Tax=Alkalihalobacterium alkalicellulosilyticum TaxID=1912214 RepID=UPI0009971E54|nr:hypothetical protein [Bacillus alkalicellulosilyticus]
MSKKMKLLFSISIGLNIFLITIVVMTMIKTNFVKEQIFVTEVQSNLVQLEILIAYQIDNEWSEPNLVTSKIGDVLNGLRLGITTGNQLGTLSKSDNDILESLYSNLSRFPTNGVYNFVELNDEDISNFENLRETLRKVGLGVNITISANINSFMRQAEGLNEKLNPKSRVMEIEDETVHK